MQIYTKNVNFFTKNKIKKIYSHALEVLGEDGQSVAVSVIFVSKEAIQKLNKENRNIDKVTDVLSFPFYEKKKDEKLSTFEKDEYGQIYVGDIAICKQVAKEQARQYGHSYHREVCFLALHGFLHLLGYDHIKDEERIEMEELAEKILTDLGVTRSV